MRKLRNRSAFTLIELLVVILVIGILIAVAAPSFLGQKAKAQDSAARQELATAYKAAKAAVVAQNGDYSALAVGSLVAEVAASEPQLSFVASASAVADKVAVHVAANGSLELRRLSASGSLCTLTAPKNGQVSAGCVDAVVADYNSRVLDSAPVAFYHLGEAAAATTMTDSSGSGFNGSYVGSQVLHASPGLLGSGADGARNFYSNTVYGSVPYRASLNAPKFSVEFFFRLNNAWFSNFSELVNAGGFRLFVKQHTGNVAQGTLLFQPGTPAVTVEDQNSVILLPNTTHHLIVSYDGATARIYVDGKLRWAQAVTGYVPNASAATRIGSMVGVTQQTNTIVDELAFYNRELVCGTTTLGQSCTAGSEIGKHYAAR